MELLINKQVQKDLIAIPKPIYFKLKELMLSLAVNPLPNGVRKLSGMDNIFRVKMGKYRIVYHLDQPAKVVTILAVAHRKEVYR